MYIKQGDEEIHQQYNQQQRFIQPEIEEDYINIDEMIMGFKRNETDITKIQEKLMKVIHKVQGEDEAKLTQFLQELILKMNSSSG